MDTALVVIAALIGLLVSPLVVAVSVRAFEDGPLLRGSDLGRPLRLPEDVAGGDLPRWKLPLTMIAVPVLFGAAVPIAGGWVLPAYLWFIAITVTLTLTDLDRYRIPDRVLFPGTIVGAVLLGLGAVADGDWRQLWPAVAGAFLYLIIYGAIYFVAPFVFGRDRLPFGFGDVKLSFLLGLFLGYVDWSLLLIGFIAAYLIGGIVSLVLLATRIRTRKDHIAFGPFMVAGAYVALWGHEAIRNWYNS